MGFPMLHVSKGQQLQTKCSWWSQTILRPIQLKHEDAYPTSPALFAKRLSQSGAETPSAHSHEEVIQVKQCLQERGLGYMMPAKADGMECYTHSPLDHETPRRTRSCHRLSFPPCSRSSCWKKSARVSLITNLTARCNGSSSSTQVLRWQHKETEALFCSKSHSLKLTVSSHPSPFVY